MDFTWIYNTMSHLNLIDKDDIILYFSSQVDIIDKIHKKRRDLQSIFYLYDDKIRTIHNFLKYVTFRNRIRDIIATTRRNADYYINTETLLGVPLDEIKEELFFSYNDNGFTYGFDIRELDKLIDYKLPNPYNTKKFPKNIIRHVKRLMRNKNFGDILAYIQMSIPLNSNESAKIASLFNKLTSLFVYPDIRKFLKFTGKQYLYFIQDLRTNDLVNSYIKSYHYELLVKIYNEDNISRTRRIVLDILLDILNVNDNNSYTRALVVSEQIRNTVNSDDSDDSDDSDNSSNNNYSVIRRTNPLFLRRTTNVRRRNRRLLRLSRNTNSIYPRISGPPLRPPPNPPVPIPIPPPLPPPQISTHLIQDSISAPPRTPPSLPPGINNRVQIYNNVIADTENILSNLENRSINDVSISEITNSIQNQINNLINRINSQDFNNDTDNITNNQNNNNDDEEEIIFNSDDLP